MSLILYAIGGTILITNSLNDVRQVVVTATDPLAEKAIVLPPGGIMIANMPMEKAAQYVVVARMFIDLDKARLIEAGNNHLMPLPDDGLSDMT